MAVIITQTALNLNLDVKDGNGDTVYNQQFTFPQGAPYPSLPQEGDQWDFLVDGNQFKTNVTVISLSSFAGTNNGAWTTTISVNAELR